MKVLQKENQTLLRVKPNYWQPPWQSKIRIVDELPHLSSWIWNVTVKAFCKNAADVLTAALQAHLLSSLSSGQGNTFTFSTVGVKWTKTNDPSWLWPFAAYSVWETGRVDTVGLLCCHLPRSSVPARHHGWNVLQIFNRLTPTSGWTQKTQNWGLVWSSEGAGQEGCTGSAPAVWGRATEPPTPPPVWYNHCWMVSWLELKQFNN